MNLTFINLIIFINLISFILQLMNFIKAIIIKDFIINFNFIDFVFII